MRIYNRAKFHLLNICSCEVIKFKMFSWLQSIHEMTHLGEFLGPNFPKYDMIFLKFAPELVFREGKTLF